MKIENIKIELRLDPSLAEPRIVVYAPKDTEDVRRLMACLAEEDAVVNGWSDSGVTLLREEDIVRVYSERQKVYAETKDGRFAVRERLYALEQRLSPSLFVRVSSGELVNSRHILRLDASLTGTICLHLDNGQRAYASRRQVKALKSHFGL